MKILWLVNCALPEASLLMHEKPTPFGGWLVGTSRELVRQEDIKLSIAFPKNGISDIQVLSGEKIKYYAFPAVDGKNIKGNKKNTCFKKILEETKPDIIHIFGTEYAHTLDMINTCEEEKVVITIQGLVSVISKHYMAYLPERIQRRFTFRDFIKQDNLKQQQKKFAKRGKFEIEALKKVKHVIGRTTWDKACTTQINQDIKYHFCNETLRDEFYKHMWDISKCEKYSIFISQGGYPIKGLHFMLEAMPLILKRFPDAKIYVGGQDITKTGTFKENIKISSYGKYIKELIRKNDLQNRVVFTGILDERQMCERHLESNVFVCPSSIENSPNSLGEAMMLGVPCVASDVGGVADMLKHREEGFIYQTDAPYMLAHYVCEIFDNKVNALKFSKNARVHAMKMHDRGENLRRLMEIHKGIIG